MPSKRSNVIEAFDPNKSDSDDENFELEATRGRPRKSTKRSRPPTKKSNQKKRRKRNEDSDISEDSDGSEDEDSFSDDLDISEPEMDEVTGRPKRKAKTLPKSYVEDSDEDLEEKDVKSEAKEPTVKKHHIVTLKLGKNTPANKRSTRAGSAARGQGIPSIATTTATTRRNTRANTIDKDDLVELSTSGRHVVRASHTPEPQPLSGRPTRGAKSAKQPAAITEALHESSSYEQAEDDGPLIGTDVLEADGQATPAQSIHDSHDEEERDNDDANDANAGADADADNDDVDIDVDEEGVDANTKDKGPAIEGDAGDDEDDEDDEPVAAKGRSRGKLAGNIPTEDLIEDEEPNAEVATSKRRLTRKSGKSKDEQEQVSDFEPDHDSADDDLSVSEASPRKNNRDNDDYDESPVGRGRTSRLGKSKSNQSSRRRRGQAESDSDMEQSPEKEAAEELQELAGRRKRPMILQTDGPRESRRARKEVNYSIIPLSALNAADELMEDVGNTPSRNARGRADASKPWDRSWASTLGPFGGAGGPLPIVGGPWGPGAVGGADSDSSDDEGASRPGAGGNAGMTPTSAMGPGLLPGIGQTNNIDVTSGTPANVGRVKSARALADADPLGVDADVDFSKVGGLEGHINQLKEMVQMPLLYPEVFMKLHVTPPRGVLFHGPPGTGKTLLARALAASVSSGGRKVTFYMRKGADALSKWVGEAERQLRLLFEEARRTQPSIIFFDEIDGLAPVRSSKQEQIHASIVSTLLALMDGMDGRGQVIVIGATNRPDNIDPALRRPGRFDREFYFPLPDADARLAIINIHTKDWGIDDTFKRSLSGLTKGYGGADLRALCTEAALNAVQRTFPQIYSSDERLLIDTNKIKISAADFMISIKKMIPSSERSTSSGAAPLPKTVEPLLRDQLKVIEDIVDGMIPKKKKTTALEEALYEQYEDDDLGFSRVMLQQEFENARVFRPRLLIKGSEGMGQGYLGSALLNHFEGLHVQNFDLPTIYSDSTRSPEAAIVQLFTEVKRHKPSVIYLPGIDTWYKTVPGSVITTFMGMLKSIATTDPILLLGITDNENPGEDLERIFAFSQKGLYTIEKPTEAARKEFFSKIVEYANLNPKDFPDPLKRKKRKLEQLQPAPPPPPPPPYIPSRAEVKAQKKRDHQTLNQLKIHLQPIMDQMKKKYRKFHHPAIPRSQYQYLFAEQDPSYVRPDVSQPERAYEIVEDKEGTGGLRDTATGKFFYNLELSTIEERLSNGYYCRPKDFVKDVKHLMKDNVQLGDDDRRLRAREMLVNVEVDVDAIEKLPVLADCENVYQRQIKRDKEAEEKRRKEAANELAFASPVRSNVQEGTHLSSMNALSDIPNPEGTHTGRSQAPAIIPFSTPAQSNGYGSSYSSEGQNLRLSNDSSAMPGSLDVEMSGTNNYSSQQPFTPQAMQLPKQEWPVMAMPRGGSNMSGHATGFNTQQSQSMTSALHRMPHKDDSPSELLNSASTTTSGKKTSENQTSRSSFASVVTNGVLDSSYNRIPDDSHLPNTQDTNPDRHLLSTQSQDTNPDRHLLSTQYQDAGTISSQSQDAGAASTQSQDAGVIGTQSQDASAINTESSSSQNSWAHSQAHGMKQRGILKHPSNPTSSDSQASPQPHVFKKPLVHSRRQISQPHVMSIADIVHLPISSQAQPPASQPISSGTSAPPSQKPIYPEDMSTEHLLQVLVGGTKGCTVEMLEQVYRELMVELWRQRGQANRFKVVIALAECFDSVIMDMEIVRGLEGGSLGRGWVE